MPRPLIDTKITEFTGIQENISPLSQRNSVLSCKNLESHVKPGILTLRPTYELKYSAPADTLNRINTPTPISFDNFYEESAAEGTEITCLVETGENQAPFKSGSTSVRITDYLYKGVNIWIRPYWNGVYWQDEWQWLNESFITIIKTAPDATYTNKMTIEGYIDDLSQWSIVNVTKDSTLPAAILYSEKSGTDTIIYISYFNNNWELNDQVVLMRNYIPILYQYNMFNVDKREISFHRLKNKIRIGFGGKSGRIALGVEYNYTGINLASYSLSEIAPSLTGNEGKYALCNRCIVQPYLQLNENKKDFLLSITNDNTGTLTAKTYYFRAVAKLDSGVNQYLVADGSIDCAGSTNNFKVKVEILAGSISRRLSNIDIYYSNNGLDFYYWKTFNLNTSGGYSAGSVILQDNGYLYPEESSAEQYTENSAVSASDSNSLGSWLPIGDIYEAFTVVTSTAPDNYAIKDTISGVLVYGMKFILPITGVDEPKIQVETEYTVNLDLLPSKSGTLTVGVITYQEVGTSGSYISNWITKSAAIAVTASKSSYTLTFEMTAAEKSNLDYYLSIAGVKMGLCVNFFSGSEAAGDTCLLEKFSIKQSVVSDLDTGTTLGALDSINMGYTPSYNFVKDWQSAVVINGKSYVGAGYIEKRYGQLVFFSPISGSGANQYDVLSAADFLNSDKDNYRGESIIGMSVLLNLQLIVFTEGGGVVINPDTNQTEEVARGHGVMTKETIQKYRGTIFWGTPEDIVKISASTGYVAEVLSKDSIRNIYNAAKDKTLLVSCIDVYGTYHLSMGSADSVKELLLTERGWLDQDREKHPEVMRNGFLGIVWFMDSSGNIYSLPRNQVELIGYADVYGDYRSGW